MKLGSVIYLTLSFCVSLLAAGGCKSMTPGQLARVQPYSDKPLAGNVYLLRGFIGIWSYGIDGLGKKINEAGVRASVYQEDQWNELADKIIAEYKGVADREPLVLIGHSYGADDTLRIAKRLQEHGMTVDLIITLDPVTPPKVPGNVGLVYNIYQSNALDSLPFFRGIPLETESPAVANLQNVNMRKERRDLLEKDTDHFNIEKNEKVHAEVVAKVKEFCPPRGIWAARRQQGPWITSTVRTSSVQTSSAGGDAAGGTTATGGASTGAASGAVAPAAPVEAPVRRWGTTDTRFERVP